MSVVGIDPGLMGAIAVLDAPAGDQVHDMPTVKIGKTERLRIDADSLRAMLDVFRAFTDVHLVAIERQQSMPRQGVASTFQTGYGYGLIVGVLVGLRLPWIDVRPAEWQRAVGWKGGKDGSRVLARQLHPQLAPALARVKDHGRADALLIAHYARRHTT